MPLNSVLTMRHLLTSQTASWLLSIHCDLDCFISGSSVPYKKIRLFFESNTEENAKIKHLEYLDRVEEWLGVLSRFR